MSVSTNPHKLAEVFRRILEKAGDSMQDAAIKLGCNRQTIKNILGGADTSGGRVRKIIEVYLVEEDPVLLRELMLGFLSTQFTMEQLKLAQLDR